MTHRWGICGAVAFGVLISATPAMAQACALSPGDTVRVTTDRGAQDTSAGVLRPPNYFGAFEGQDAVGITLQADGRLLIVPRDAVAGVAGLCAVTTTPGLDGVKRGAVYGVVAGIVLGFAYSRACPSDADDECGGFLGHPSTFQATVTSGAVVGVLGALFGGVSGSLAGERRWVPVSSLAWP